MKRGPKPKGESKRKILNARLSPEVIEALRHACAENGTTLTEEIESRVVLSLIEDGLLDYEVAMAVCGTVTSVAAALSFPAVS